MGLSTTKIMAQVHQFRSGLVGPVLLKDFNDGNIQPQSCAMSTEPVTAGCHGHPHGFGIFCKGNIGLRCSQWEGVESDL